MDASTLAHMSFVAFGRDLIQWLCYFPKNSSKTANNSGCVVAVIYCYWKFLTSLSKLQSSWRGKWKNFYEDPNKHKLFFYVEWSKLRARTTRNLIIPTNYYPSICPPPLFFWYPTRIQTTAANNLCAFMYLI